VRKLPRKQSRTPEADPEVGPENGLKGKRHVLKLLRAEFPASDGYRVEDIARNNPAADHDIAIHKGGKLIEAVEVNTRFGKPPDPVPISDRELECRKRLRSEHDMCIVYSSKGGDVHSVLRIQRQKAYTLSPRQYWLRPGAI
jgi:hypothetical protein